MTVVTQLLAAVGTLTAVVLLVLMAAVPLLIDLPLRRRGPHHPILHHPILRRPILRRPILRRPILRRPTPHGRGH